MSDTSIATPIPGYRRLDGRQDCHAAMREAFALAADHGCRELLLCDPDFADWPLGERAVVETLTRWAYAHRRFTMVAQQYDAIVAKHARWVAWRRQWAHVIDCRVIHELEPGQMPTLLLAPGVVTLRIVDREQHRGVWSPDGADAAEAVRRREQFDAIAQRSVDGFAAHTLGL